MNRKNDGVDDLRLYVLGNWIRVALAGCIALFSGCNSESENQIIEDGFKASANRKPPASDPGSTSAASTSHSVGALSPSGIPTQAANILDSMGIEFVRIPAGGFMMGDLRDGVRIKDKVKPHKVQISQSFEMSKHEVTVGQFRLFVDATNRITEIEAAAGSVRGFDKNQATFVDNGRFSWRSPGYEQSKRHPVVYVTRSDAMDFCQWLTSMDSEGKTYRLPTEAEWEYACRAGTKTRFSCGDDPTEQAGFGNVADQALTRFWPENPFDLKLDDGFPFAAPVGTFKANPFGLYDMHGNVWEWCSDTYSSSYYAQSPEHDPTGPPPGRSFVTRGGSWVSFVADSSFRNSWEGSLGQGDLGFRVVRELVLPGGPE